MARASASDNIKNRSLARSPASEASMPGHRSLNVGADHLEKTTADAARDRSEVSLLAATTNIDGNPDCTYY